ncbi:MAG: TolC family protein, partial [Bacteroidota bacterium]|nr:TolC family protein [Bacteroidota bacterium]
MWYLPLLILVTTAAGAVGQQPLTLSRAIQIATERNPDVIAARLEVERADARVREAVGTALPSVGFAANYSRHLQLPVFFLPDFRNPNSGQVQAIRIGSENSVQAQLQLTQVLFNQAVLTGIGASQIYAQAARMQYRATVARTVATVKSAFYGALLARAALEATRASLQRAERFAQDVGVLASQGLVADYDALRARVQVEQVRTLVSQAELGYEAAVRQLKLVTGIPQESPVEIRGELEMEFQPTRLPTPEEVLQQVLSRNPQLRVLELQEGVQRDIARIYRAESYPILVGFGTYTYQGQSPTFSNFLTARSAAVGVQLSLSLFQGLQTTARVEQAEIERQKIQQQRERLREAVKLQVLVALEQQRLAQQRLEVARGVLTQAERGYEIARI